MECYTIFADIIALGGVLFEDPKHITILTFSAMLWAFLGIFPFIQVKYTYIAIATLCT